MTTSLSLTETVLRKYRNSFFIETGTGEGGGVKLADGCGFHSIITIDVNKNSLANARRLVPRCLAIYGDSRECLKEILATVHWPATFFLDAHSHYSEQMANPVTCVLEELDAILAWWIPGSVILIDDWRMFGGGRCGGAWAHLVSQQQLLSHLQPFCTLHDCGIWWEDASGNQQDIVTIGVR